jgi:hypothetical protein
MDQTTGQWLTSVREITGEAGIHAPQRDRLYGEIPRRLVERPDRSVRRHWGAVLHVARRRDDPLAAAD